MSKPIVSLVNVEKWYGTNHVVKNMNINIAEGEFLTLLGPSGCGKTTTLRMISGFELPTSGVIKVQGESVEKKEPYQRDVNTVFQNYALFPNMNVFDNVAYGLKVKKVPKAEIKERVTEMLKLVQLEGFGKRRITQMSGGQKQRVAIARALINRPKVLLLDEPLGALDLKLRKQMQIELKRLQRKLGITFVYVTHDQEEALAISDRIAVMKNGVIQQVGKPQEIYTRPANEFVANFIGTSNFLPGTVLENENGMAKLSVLNETEITMPLKSGVTGNLKLSVRPEEFLIGTEQDKGLRGEIVFRTFLGDFVNYEVQLSNGQSVEVNQYGNDRSREYEPGDKVILKPQLDKINIYSENGEEAVIEWKK